MQDEYAIAQTKRTTAKVCILTDSKQGTSVQIGIDLYRH